MMKCRFIVQLNLFGSFWAIIMLSIESYHMLMKALGRSRKNLIACILNNYSIFSLDQLDWQFTSEYATPPVSSSVSLFVPRSFDVTSEVTFAPRSKKTQVHLPDEIYRQILELDAANDHRFRAIVNSYIDYVVRTERQNGTVMYLNEWVTTPACRQSNELLKLQAARTSSQSVVHFLSARLI
jgi:hypothetical protein